MPEDGGIARGGAQQVEQNSDSGGFAGAVQPEESKNLTTWNLQVKMIYGGESPVTFGQSTNGDRRRAGEHNRILTQTVSDSERATENLGRLYGVGRMLRRSLPASRTAFTYRLAGGMPARSGP